MLIRAKIISTVICSLIIPGKDSQLGIIIFYIQDIKRYCSLMVDLVFSIIDVGQVLSNCLFYQGTLLKTYILQIEGQPTLQEALVTDSQWVGLNKPVFKVQIKAITMLKILNIQDFYPYTPTTVSCILCWVLLFTVSCVLCWVIF